MRFAVRRAPQREFMTIEKRLHDAPLADFTGSGNGIPMDLRIDTVRLDFSQLMLPPVPNAVAG